MNKEKYGEVETPVCFVEEMLDILPSGLYKDGTKKWLDPGAGKGVFSLSLLRRNINRENLYLVECNPKNIDILKDNLKGCKIIEGDFLKWEIPMQFDVIVGNPPFNSGGLKKVPTNRKRKKKEDGRTIWHLFVRKAISILKPGGYLVMIIPSIWMRPVLHNTSRDKERNGMHEYLRQYDLSNIHCFTNTETNRIFSGQAQTPTCYFMLRKRPARATISLYDKSIERKILFPNRKGALPVYSASIIKKLDKYVKKVGCVEVKKTNMPPRMTSISTKYGGLTPHKNIRTCLLDGNTPCIEVEYSNKELAYSGQAKVIMAHKMYGFPFMDKLGEYGISNRDNYVILDDLEVWYDFLSTKTARYIFESARYRMKYLEREAFGFIPNVVKLEDFPLKNITDETIADYFGFSEKERFVISLCREYKSSTLNKEH